MEFNNKMAILIIVQTWTFETSYLGSMDPQKQIVCILVINTYKRACLVTVLLYAMRYYNI